MKYRKKPVAVEAIQYKECITNNILNWEKFTNKSIKVQGFQEILYLDITRVTIPTLEGKMLVSEGDYIIKGVNGEFYPCKPDIFHKTYEKVK